MSTDTLTAATHDAAAETDDKPVHWTVVVAVILTAVLEVLDMTIVNVALPHIKAAFGITSDQTIWIITSYIVAAVVVMPLTGLFSRWFGATPADLGGHYRLRDLFGVERPVLGP